MIDRRAPARAAVLAAAAALIGACGGDDGDGDDGGSEQSSIEVLNPPGEQIGLSFYGEVTLRALYRGPDGAPLAGAALGFELLSTATESTGGSTVSASEAGTGADGVASVRLVAGAERVNFRVQVTAVNAPPALFYITVSEEGFADLIATPEHGGFRAADDFRALEVRLYRAADLRCAGLDVDAPPESVFPVRALGGFGEEASYRNVGAGEAYTVVAWGSIDAQGSRLASGCVELDGDHVRAATATRFPLPVADRLLAAEDGIEIASTFNATPLGLAVGAAGPDPWSALDCPRGRAQLLIDCALDAQAPDGALDCAVGGASPLVAEVQARRGAPDPAGCRPGAAGGGASLDALVEQRLGPPWPEGGALEDLLAAQRAPLVSFALVSRLGPDGGGLGALAHQLARVEVSSGGAAHALGLVASDRPVISQTAPASVDAPSGRLSLGAHSFTLDYGPFARDAFTALGLEPAGLADRATDLGTALYDSVALEDQSGCPAFSQVVCGPIGRAAACLEPACAAAQGPLDLLLDGWWQVLDGAGRDLTLSGSAPLHDRDADLVLDGLGLAAGPAGRGEWSATMTLSSGEAVPLTGTFSGSAPARRATRAD